MVDKTLDDAKQLQADANKLQHQFENRLSEWENEKLQKQKLFMQEIEVWRSQEHAKFMSQIEDERIKIEIRNKENLAKIIKNNARDSMDISARFSAKLLSEFADQDLENKIIEKVIARLNEISGDHQEIFKKSFQDNKIAVIQSAYELSEVNKNLLNKCINRIVGEQPETVCTPVRILLAGVNIQIGSIFIKASLRDELKFFAEVKDAIV
jgi:F-type H+-transporting ATPase subunit b